MTILTLLPYFLRSLLRSLLFFAISLILITGCTNPAVYIQTTTQDAAAATSTATNATRLGFSAWPGWFPWEVAQDQGLFKKESASVALKWFDGYLESISTLSAGQIDANSQTLGDTVSAVAGGADQVIVLVNDNSTGNDKIIAKAEIKTIADLKGKKVAAEEGTVDHFLLLLGLQKAGLSPQDIQFIPLETGKAAAAFVSGQVDACAVFAPFTTQALKRPNSKELFSSRDFPGAISDHLVVNRKYIYEHPEQVQDFVDSWFTTLDFLKKNQTKSYAIMAKRAGVPVSEYNEYADGTRLFTLQENLQAFQPGNTMNSLLYAADAMSNFLIDVGLAKTKPNTTLLFDDRFIKNYAQRQVTS